MTEEKRESMTYIRVERDKDLIKNHNIGKTCPPSFLSKLRITLKLRSYCTDTGKEMVVQAKMAASEIARMVHKV